MYFHSSLLLMFCRKYNLKLSFILTKSHLLVEEWATPLIINCVNSSWASKSLPWYDLWKRKTESLNNDSVLNVCQIPTLCLAKHRSSSIEKVAFICKHILCGWASHWGNPGPLLIIWVNKSYPNAQLPTSGGRSEIYKTKCGKYTHWDWSGWSHLKIQS